MKPMQWLIRHAPGLALVLPALATVVLLFIVPLGASVTGAFQTESGPGLDNFRKAFELYGTDIAYTVGVVVLAVTITAVLAIAISGYLTLGEHPGAVAALRWLYRWPMFIPFIVVGQLARAFLAKNGLMNNTLVSLDLLTPMQTIGLLDWRGIVAAFAWKQAPFVTLLLAGAMACVDRHAIEAARNLGASRLRILLEIMLPQVSRTLLVGLVLSFVTMMSVLSVPLMIGSQSPTMITVDMAFRINTYRDYGTANALGLVSLAITACVAWIYLKLSLQERRTS